MSRRRILFVKNAIRSAGRAKDKGFLMKPQASKIRAKKAINLDA